jgi:chromosome segregation protein
VTLEGDVVNPGGSMTGGGARKTKSILTQKDELTTMRHQLENYQKQTQEFFSDCAWCDWNCFSNSCVCFW